MNMFFTSIVDDNDDNEDGGGDLQNKIIPHFLHATPSAPPFIKNNILNARKIIVVLFISK